MTCKKGRWVYERSQWHSKAIKETNRRREIQIKYNEENGIVPTTIIKDVREVIEATKVAEESADYGMDSAVEYPIGCCMRIVRVLWQ